MGTNCIYRWKGHQQDVVEQMLVGLGWRITGYCDAADTRTVAITSRDAAGVRFIITAHKDRWVMVGDGWWHGTIVDMSQVKVHIDTETCVSIYDLFIFNSLSLSVLYLHLYIHVYIYIYHISII